MIYGIGTDIIEISRIQKAIQKKSFLQKIFTQNEIQYFKQKGEHPETLAGIFAAKESVAKAIGTGFRGFSPIDIEILHDTSQKPTIHLSDNIKIKLQINEIYVSISHCKSYAQAFVILV